MKKLISFFILFIIAITILISVRKLQEDKKNFVPINYNNSGYRNFKLANATTKIIDGKPGLQNLLVKTLNNYYEKGTPQTKTKINDFVSTVKRDIGNSCLDLDLSTIKKTNYNKNIISTATENQKKLKEFKIDTNKYNTKNIGCNLFNGELNCLTEVREKNPDLSWFKTNINGITNFLGYDLKDNQLLYNINIVGEFANSCHNLEYHGLEDTRLLPKFIKDLTDHNRSIEDKKATFNSIEKEIELIKEGKRDLIDINLFFTAPVTAPLSIQSSQAYKNGILSTLLHEGGLTLRYITSTGDSINEYFERDKYILGFDNKNSSAEYNVRNINSFSGSHTTGGTYELMTTIKLPTHISNGDNQTKSLYEQFNDADEIKYLDKIINTFLEEIENELNNN